MRKLFVLLLLALPLIGCANNCPTNTKVVVGDIITYQDDFVNIKINLHEDNDAWCYFYYEDYTRDFYKAYYDILDNNYVSLMGEDMVDKWLLSIDENYNFSLVDITK